jgi:hypothetical protein
MTISTRALLATAFLLSALDLAIAGASSVPANYTPDPALQRASRSELEARIRKACTVVQAREQGVAEISLSGPCGCYASRSLRAFSEAEIQAYRDTGIFNDTAREKAYAALAACGVQRAG